MENIEIIKLTATLSEAVNWKIKLSTNKEISKEMFSWKPLFIKYKSEYY